MEVDSVADIEIRREKNPVATPSFMVALLLALIVFFITKSVPQTVMIVLAELLLRLFLK